MHAMKSRGPDSGRDETVDMARGFALFGILITNAAVLTDVLTSGNPLTSVRLWSHDRIADIDRRVPVHLLAADRQRTDRAGAYRSPLVTCAFSMQRKGPVENNSRPRAGDRRNRGVPRGSVVQRGRFVAAHVPRFRGRDPVAGSGRCGTVRLPREPPVCRHIGWR